MAPIVVPTPNTTITSAWGKSVADAINGAIPGEVFYNQITAPVLLTNGAASAAQMVIAGSATVYDGRPVIVEFSSPGILTPNAAGASVMLNLWDANTDLGYFGQVLATSPQIQVGATFRRRITPTAGTHTYQIVGWRTVGGASGTVQAGPGGIDQFCPAFLRIVRA
jgi:hypothetical protein